MNTSDVSTSDFSSGEEFPPCFSEWLKRRRQELDLTQEQLAQHASCSVFAIRKLEAGERRPSRQLAESLAKALEIPCQDRAVFIQAARGELSMERLASLDSQPAVQSSPSPLPVNLPKALTPFIGREPELSALRQLLDNPQCSLITIVGPGGIGKSRLAIEAAQHLQDLFPDGIWFVPLAPLNSPTLIVPTIADAVDFKFSDPTNQQAQLLGYLRNKKALLVLDNAEHLLDGVGMFTEILEHCPDVKLLVTSRERLNLMSEWVFELQGLPVPTKEQGEQMEAYSSVALFLQSARRAQAGFALRGEERQWVRNICQTMEGMPLGIELSAAWVGLLSCEEISREIERNIDFLTVSMRDLPERHRSMRATLDHSWNLLNDEERLILSRLSVFQGPFRREAAEEICGANLAVLSSLRNKTLLNRSDQDCFSLHELVRQYAEHRLAEDPSEQERVKDRHAAYYAQRLAEWEKALKSSLQVESLNEMAQNIDNLRLAWQWMIHVFQPNGLETSRFSPELIHTSLFSLSLFHELRCRNEEAIGLFKESVDWLNAARRAGKPADDCRDFDAVLGHITAYLGVHYYYLDEIKQSYEYLEEAIRLFQNGPASVERAQAQLMLGGLYSFQGKLQKAAELLEQSRAVFREAGDVWWYPLALIHLARVRMHMGEIQKSQGLAQEAVQLIEPGDIRLGLPLRNDFAFIKYLLKDYAGAEQLFLDNLQLSFQLGFDLLTAGVYLSLGRIALETNRVELAGRYLQESIELSSKHGVSIELAMDLLYSGKCCTARMEFEPAREEFRQVIKLGQRFDAFYLVYWAMVNIARTYLMAGQIETALEIALVLKDCFVEYKIAQDDGNCLLADLQAVLPKKQVEPVTKRGNGKISADQAEAAVLAYALEHITQ